jgi:hypothetical protein
MTGRTETTTDALKRPSIIIDRAQAEIDRLRQLIEEAYHEGVRDGKDNWWESYARRKRDGLA